MTKYEEIVHSNIKLMIEKYLSNLPKGKTKCNSCNGYGKIISSNPHLMLTCLDCYGTGYISEPDWIDKLYGRIK